MIFGIELFQDIDLDLQSDYLLIPPVLAVAFFSVVIGIWALFVFFNCLGEAHRFSAWKALAATILGVLIVLGVVIIFVVPFAIFA